MISQDCRKTAAKKSQNILASRKVCNAVVGRPYVVCAFIVRSSYAFDPREGYKCKDRGKHQAYIHHISTEAYLFVMAIIPQRVAILQRMLRDEEERHDSILALLIRERLRQRRQQRQWWVKPWIERRRLFGQYYTLFQELDRESEADYMNYMRMSRNMFAELLYQVAPRIT